MAVVHALEPSFPFETKDGRRGLVRPARPRDARAALAIVGEAMRERPRTLLVLDEEFWGVREWRRHRRGWEASGVWLVAEVGGRLAGILTAGRSALLARRHEAGFGITVGTRYRGIGVGQALLRALERWARQHGITRITLGVFPQNERARALYRKLGYEEEGIARAAARFPEGYQDVLNMAKVLDHGW